MVHRKLLGVMVTMVAVVAFGIVACAPASAPVPTAAPAKPAAAAAPTKAPEPSSKAAPTAAPAAVPTKAPASAPTKEAEVKPIPVNIGWLPGGFYAFYVARELKLFQKAGIEPNFIKFTAGPPMFPAFESGSIDIGWGGAPPAIIGAAQGVPIKVIAMEATTNNPLIARKDRGIKDLIDCKGKKLGTVKGSGGYFTMMKLLSMKGLKSSDFTFVDIQTPSLVPAFIKGDVDAIWAWPPWAQLAEEQNGIRIADERDIFGAYPGAPFMARTGWLKEKPEAVQRFLKAIDMAQQTYAKDATIAIKAMANEMGITEAMAKRIFETDVKSTLEQQASPTDPYSVVVGPDKNGQAKIYQAMADFFFENDFIKTRPDMGKAFDGQPITEYIKSTRR